MSFNAFIIFIAWAVYAIGLFAPWFDPGVGWRNATKSFTWSFGFSRSEKQKYLETIQDSKARKRAKLYIKIMRIGIIGFVGTIFILMIFGW